MFDQMKIRSLFIKPTQKMDLTQLSAVIGREIKSVAELTASDIAALNQRIGAAATTAPATPAPATPAPATPAAPDAPAAETQEEEPVTMASITQAIQTALAPVTKAMAAIETRLATAETNIATLNGEPAAAPVTQPITSGEAPKLYPWDDPMDPINQQANKDLGL
jgi:hypothetical protein